MRLLAICALLALSACAPVDDVFGETDDVYARCRALPEPEDRRACIAKARANAETLARVRDIGPPDCHPASTNPRDRDDDTC